MYILCYHGNRLCLDEQNSSITLLYLLDILSLCDIFTHVVFTSPAPHACEFILFFAIYNYR